MKLKDQAILKISYVKQSNNMIGQEDFVVKTQDSHFYLTWLT